MEEEQQHHYELRSRSRSRSHTPMILNQVSNDTEIAEHHYDLRQRSRDRSHTPGEVTSSRRSGTRSLPGSAGKQRDKSIDTIVEGKEDAKTDTATTDQSRRSESSGSSSLSRKVERRSERQRAKRQIFSNGQKETIEHSLETKKMEKRKSVTPRRTITSDYSSEEGEKEDPPSRPGSAYEIYKQAGEWWNVFPKTDYTYSQNSQSRYEIAPGVLAMPNMSRPSIHSDGNSTSGSVNSLSQQNLSQYSRETRESYDDSLERGDSRETIEQNRLNEVNAGRLRSRVSRTETSEGSILYKKTQIAQYKSHREIIYGDPSKLARRDLYGRSSQIDSDAELDEALSSRYVKREEKWKIRTWIETFGRIILTWMYSGWDFVNVRILQRKNATTSHGYHRYRGEESKWKKAWAPIDRIMQYIYFLLVRILFLDTWLLSRVSSTRNYLKRRQSKVLWLILLPPLLLGGFWFLSCAYDVARLLSVVGSSSKEHYEMKPGALELGAKQEERRSSSAGARIDEEKIRNLMEPLIKRVERLESAETIKAQRMENMSQAMNELRDNNVTIWERYSEKLRIIEKNMEEKTGESLRDVRAIKMEFQSLRGLYARLKTCCHKNAIFSSSDEMEKQIDAAFAGYFGDGVSKRDLKRIIENLIMTSDDKRSINDRAFPVKNDKSNCNEGISLSEADVRKIVDQVLKIYDADKTGRVDYALESAGGQVISTRCTQRYNVNTRAFKLLGLTLFYESNNPRTVIQGNSLQPGVCWAFQDFPGYLLVKLRSLVRVTAFTVEHVPRALLPNREMRSAPRKFNVWGLKDENDVDPIMFGEYEFEDSEESLQYFRVQNTEISEPYEYVELRIHSNHGQLEYTCLYRFRVHGIPV